MISHLPYAIHLVLGDSHFVLEPGDVLPPQLIHVYPSTPQPGMVVGANTGWRVDRVDDTRCGGASAEYLKPDHHYAFTITDKDTCAGKPAPYGQMSDD